MSDTRTIYLKNNEGTIYSSDPSNVGYEYLNISDFDSLNPSENSIFTSATNISLMYSSYDVKLVLTFVSNYDNGRQARAGWVAKNQNSINQISVANTNNPDLIFSKQAKIKTIDFIENPYVNGVQAELTLELAGRWQSSVNRTSATVYPYTGGTKKYDYSTFYDSLFINRNLLLGTKDFNFASSIGVNGSAIFEVLNYENGVNMLHITAPINSGQYTGIFFPQNNSNKIQSGEKWSFSFDIKGTGDFTEVGVEGPEPWVHSSEIGDDWSRISSTNTASTNTNLVMYFNTSNKPLDIYVKLMKLEIGDTATNWKQAPEDVNRYVYHYSTLDRSLLTNRNLLSGTQKFTFSGNIGTNASTMNLMDFDGDTKMIHVTAPQGSGKWVGIYLVNEILKANNIYSFGFDIIGTGIPSDLFGWGDYTSDRTQTGSISPSEWSRMSISGTVTKDNSTILLYFNTDNQALDVYIKLWKIENSMSSTNWTPAIEETGLQPKPTYKYGYQIITDEVKTDGYNGFIINIPSQTTPVNVTLTAPNGLSATLTTSQTNVPLQISSDMIGYSLDNFDTFTLLNKGFPASKYWDNLLSVYSTIQTILNANTVTVSVASNTGSTIPFEFYLYKLQDLI